MENRADLNYSQILGFGMASLNNLGNDNSPHLMESGRLAGPGNV